MRRQNKPLFGRKDRPGCFQPLCRGLVQLFSPVVRNRRGHYQALFEKYRKRGFLKTLVNGEVYYLDDVPPLERNSRHHIAVQIDAVDVEPANASASPTASPWP